MSYVYNESKYKIQTSHDMFLFILFQLRLHLIVQVKTLVYINLELLMSRQYSALDKKQ